MPLLNHEKGTEKRMKWLDNTFFSNTNITVNRCGFLTCWNLAFVASKNFSCFLVDLQIILFIFEPFFKKKNKFLWKYVSSSFLDTFPKRNNMFFYLYFLQLENSTTSYIPGVMYCYLIRNIHNIFKYRNKIQVIVWWCYLCQDFREILLIYSVK